MLEELPDLIDKLEIKMKDAAKDLNFEEASNLRDTIKKLRQKLARNNWKELISLIRNDYE